MTNCARLLLLLASWTLLQVTGCAETRVACPAGFELDDDGACIDLECVDVNCDDGNECTADTCTNGMCANDNVSAGAACDRGAGECMNGACVPTGTGGTGGAGGVGGMPALCADAETRCDDGNECTENTCNRADGACSNPNETNGTSCDFSGLPGVCMTGVCEDAALCADAETRCDDGNECTENTCNPADGVCSNPNETNGTSCDFSGLPGVCRDGVCRAPPTCAAILAADPGAIDGIYTIDPAQSGPNPPVETYCDMTTDGGGWTQLYDQDVRIPPGYLPTATWAAGVTSTAPNGGQFSILQLTSDFERGGRYEFLIDWDDRTSFVRWEQSENPFVGRGTVSNVVKSPTNQVGCDTFDGLGADGSESEFALLDGTDGVCWWWAIGTSTGFGLGIPTYRVLPNTQFSTPRMRLWVR